VGTPELLQRNCQTLRSEVLIYECGADEAGEENASSGDSVPRGNTEGGDQVPLTTSEVRRAIRARN